MDTEFFIGQAACLRRLAQEAGDEASRLALLALATRYDDRAAALRSAEAYREAAD